MSRPRLPVVVLAVATIALSVSVWSCASHKRPVLYPNAYLQQVGEDQAQADIDECFEFAATAVDQYRKGERALEGGAKGATVGAAAGAAGSAVGGGSVGRGAGTGAAAGAAIGVVSGLWSGSEPEPIFKQFVEQCLRDKGYDPKGWQ